MVVNESVSEISFLVVHVCLGALQGCDYSCELDLI